MTLACKDANSNLIEVVSAADEDRFGNSLLQIWKLRFGHKDFCLDFTLVKILKLKLRQYFEAEV